MNPANEDSYFGEANAPLMFWKEALKVAKEVKS